jgi:hypothetical protein
MVGEEEPSDRTLTALSTRSNLTSPNSADPHCRRRRPLSSSGTINTVASASQPNVGFFCDDHRRFLLCCLNVESRPIAIWLRLESVFDFSVKRLKKRFALLDRRLREMFGLRLFASLSSIRPCVRLSSSPKLALLLFHLLLLLQIALFLLRDSIQLFSACVDPHLLLLAHPPNSAFSVRITNRIAKSKTINC